ncbi:MAG: hypothetical protein PHW54_03760 [Candidatus Omnitrophica bacterium]|nr:hypothetical protein [Candidatus Omnitrophota bacterium]
MKIARNVFIITIILFGVSFNNYLKAEPEKAISTDPIKEEFLKTDFPELIVDDRKLPAEVQKAFSGRMKLANPEEDYNNSDAIKNPSLPSCRLFFAGEAQNKVFVYYEQGGVFLTYRLALFTLDEKGRISGQNFYFLEAERAKDLAALKSLFQKYSGRIN